VKSKRINSDRPGIPRPARPLNRREPLPWQRPKPLEEDPQAPARVQAILESPSYRRADVDLDFLARGSMRGVRLQIDYFKPELLFEEHRIRLPRLYGKLADEAEELARRARTIKIPNPRRKHLEVEYQYELGGRFCGFAGRHQQDDAL
jgi:hypothetical protein